MTSKLQITKTTEWENERTRLVKLHGLPRSPNYPFNHNRSNRYTTVAGRKISEVVIHTLAGPYKAGVDAAIGLAQWIIRPPRFQLDDAGKVVYRNSGGKRKPVVIGGGRGWPGPPYTFLVPYLPEVVDGKFEVYRLNDDDERTFHTDTKRNTGAVAVGYGGMFRTRHAPGFSDRDPHPTQIAAGQDLVLGYLLPHYNLQPADVSGHFEYGKPSCPGDMLEQWVRELQGQDVAVERPDSTPQDQRSLKTWKERQDALLDLGYDLGEFGPDGVFGHDTRSAVEAFQSNESLVADGIWGPRTEKAIRIALAELRD